MTKTYRVLVTHDVWNGQQTVEHEYEVMEKAAAVYERVCRICSHKYKRLGYGDGWEQIFEINGEHTISIYIY